MKRIISVVIAMFIFSIVSYGGEWKKDEVGYKYQEDDGTYKTGWHQDIDGEWYYLDGQTGYMLTNSKTPDGYIVSSDGTWIEGGEQERVDYSEKTYDNKVEISVSAYDNPYGAKPLGYSVPATVYYNNEYEDMDDGKITILNVESSKEGLAYISFKVDQTGYYELTAKCRYFLADGTYIDKDENIRVFNENGENNFSRTILTRLYGLRQGENKVIPINVTVLIEKSTEKL